MAPELLAAASAMMFAALHVVSKKGTQTTSVIAGLIISLATGMLILGVAAFTRLPTSLSGKGVAVIAASGILAPALARGAAIAGIDHLGPSISVPIQGGTYPLLAVLGAIIVLQEPVGGLRFAGVVAIAVGILLLSRPDEDRKRDVTRRWFFRPGVMFPIAAGLAKGSADVVRKSGLDLVPHATFGAAVGLATAVTVWLIAAALAKPVRRKITFRQRATLVRPRRDVRRSGRAASVPRAAERRRVGGEPDRRLTTDHRSAALGRLPQGPRAPEPADCPRSGGGDGGDDPRFAVG